MYLDAKLREQKNTRISPDCFAKKIAGSKRTMPETINENSQELDRWFEIDEHTPIAENETRFIVEKYVGRERPYFKSSSENS